MSIHSRHTCLISSTAITCALLCLTACIDLEHKEQPETLPDLTSEDMIKMTPEEVAEYYAKKSKLEQEAEQQKARNLGRDDKESIFDSAYSRTKRQRLGDVTRPLENNSQNTVFPWKDEDDNRSSTLLEKNSAIYQW